MTQHPIYAKRSYAAMQAGYWGLFAFILVKLIWLSPPPEKILSVAILMQMGPLLFPLMGMMRGKTYTTAWACFLALGYFAYSVALAADPAPVRYMGLAQTALSTLWFVGLVTFTRTQARAIKAQEQLAE